MFPKGIIRHPLLSWTYSKFLYICVLALSLSIVSPAHAAKPTLLVLGDSLSAGYGIKQEEGWVALLEQKLKSGNYNYRVVNASISGETTEGGLSRLPALLSRYKPDVLLIELGANDGLRGFPIKIIDNNLSAMIVSGKKNHAQVLLIAVQIPLNYGQPYTSLFEKTFRDVSHRHRIPLAPNLLGKVPLDKNLMQADGIHPNASAQGQLLDHVWPQLQPLLKQ